jgi:hypothetical protein
MWFSVLEVSRRFGGTYSLHLEGQQINPIMNFSRLLHVELTLLFGPKYEGDMFLRNVSWLKWPTYASR